MRMVIDDQDLRPGSPIVRGSSLTGPEDSRGSPRRYTRRMATVWIPLPDRDFDVTEVAVPWKLLTRAGHAVTFATEEAGVKPAADPLLLTGVLFGQLGADPEPQAFYAELEASPEFASTIACRDIET